MAICTLLFPFKWQNILIPLIPSIYQEILDAPVPFIAGLIKKSEDKLKLEQSSALFVYLDTGEIILNDQQQIITKLPNLNNLQAKLECHFKEFSKKGNAKKELCYFPGEKEITAVENICTIIEDTIRQITVTHLPIFPPMCKEEIDLDQIKKIIVKSVRTEDQEFIGKFGETQLFASFILNHYKAFSKLK